MLVILAFYVLTFIVLGPTYCKKGHITNKNLLLAYKTIAWISLIQLVVMFIRLMIDCNRYNVEMGMFIPPIYRLVCYSAVVLQFAPLVAAILVVRGRHLTDKGRKMIITLVYLQLALSVAIYAIVFGASYWYTRSLLETSTRKNKHRERKYLS